MKSVFLFGLTPIVYVSRLCTTGVGAKLPIYRMLRIVAVQFVVEVLPIFRVLPLEAVDFT